MDDEGKINGLGLGRSGVASRTAGYYGNGMKAAPREMRRRKSYLMKRYGKASALILLVAVSAVIGSSLLIAPSHPGVPAKVNDIPPPPGFYLGGYTYDSVGAPLPNCDVTITHVKTGNFSVVNSGAIAFYVFTPTWPDLSVGDEIKVTAVKDPMMGESTGYVPNAPNLRIDVTLNLAIPEFPMVILPVMGMVALVAVTSLARRRKEL